MQIYYQPDILAGVHELSAEESAHCIKVLRHVTGDIIHVVDGRGTLFEVRIDLANAKKCTFKVVKHTHKEPKNFSIHLAIAPTKSIDRIEWLVEKAVEIGVDKINLYFSRHSERKKVNVDRLEKKAIAAMKQSQQYSLPSINLYKSFSECLINTPPSHQKLIAHVDEQNPNHLLDIAEKAKDYTIFIGPEGDFSEDELNEAFNYGFSRVSLGINRLRTETAGFAACHILNLINR